VNAGDIGFVALLGGLLGLDTVSFPQAMVARPLVASTVAGAFFGAPVNGLLVGVVLELLALETLPVGASRYPEWGAASVAAGAVASEHPIDAAGALAIVALGGLAAAQLGGMSMTSLRKLNAYWARRWRASVDRGSASAVVGLQLAGLGADYLRGALLAAAAAAVLAPLTSEVLVRWTVDPLVSRSLVTAVAAGSAVGAAWKILHGARGARWYFLGGLAFGGLLLVLTR